VASAGDTPSPLPKSKEPIIVNGDKVEYFQDKKKVLGSGNISIEYKGVTLTCDTVTVYLDTREAIAEGNVRVRQKDGAYFTGDRINYNFDTQKGSVLNGYLNAKPFYGKAADIKKVTDKEFELQKGYVTTCDYEHPHYRVQSKQVKIYLGDKVVARNIVFYVGNLPVFYLPYYIQPLRDTKKMNMTLIAGKGKDWGYYLLSAYRYQFTDDLRGDILFDYRTKKGPAGGVNAYWNTKKVGNIATKFYLADENDWLTADRDPDLPVRNRYRVQVRQRWDMPKETDSSLVLEFNKLSDPDVIKDYFYKEFEEIQDPQDYNYISLVTTKPDYTTEFLIRKRFDKFYTVVERLPEYKIDIKNFRINKKLPLYYTGHASGVYLNETFASAVPSQKDLNVIRFDSYNQVSYAARLFKFWNATPYVGTEQTYYSRNAWGDTNLVRGSLNAGLNNSTKFYKTYNFNTNWLGLDINKLRHVITPTANYYFIHQPTIDPANLMQFDAIDALSAQNGISLAIENKLQTKRMQGGELKSVDLATLIISTDYQFRLNKGELELKSNKFNGVNFQLEMVPYPWLYTLSKMTVNTKKYMVDTASVDIVGNGGDKWSLGAGYKYENTTGTFVNLITSAIMYKFNDVWRARVYSQFNLDNMSFEEWETTIYRDLHCWMAEFTYGVRNNNDQTLWFIMRLKAFPDYPIGLRRTYSRPRFGTEGS
jgi:LPS-assembly protein